MFHTKHVKNPGKANALPGWNTGRQLHDVFQAEIVQDLPAHVLPAGQGKFADSHRIPLGTKPVLGVQP